MNKFVMYLSVLSLAATLGAAIAVGQTEITVGVKAGLNFATMTGTMEDTLASGAYPDAAYLVRGVGGGFVNLGLAESWSVQLEVVYTQKAGQWEYVVTQDDVTATTTQTIEIEYVEIPLFLKYRMPRESKLRPFLYTGPGIAFAAASSAKLKAVVERLGNTLRHDEYYASHISNAKSVIMEIVAGVGLEWKLGSNALTFEGRYSRNLGSVFDDVSDFDAIPEDDAAVARFPSGEALKLNHSVFSFVIGYALGL